MAHDIPHNALILVADGTQAILFRNTAQGGSELSLKEQRRLTLKDFSNDGPSGAQPQEGNAREVDEATFAKKLAQFLEAMKGRNEFEAVVIAADPQTLGQMRDALHKNVESAVVKTVSKTLTNSPIPDIEKSLAK